LVWPADGLGPPVLLDSTSPRPEAVQVPKRESIPEPETKHENVPEVKDDNYIELTKTSFPDIYEVSHQGVPAGRAHVPSLMISQKLAKLAQSSSTFRVKGTWHPQFKKWMPQP
jgi:hypothetical protein